MMPAARNDLQGIYVRIAQESEARADRVTDDLTSAAERLADFPLSGRIVPEFNHPEIREIIVGRNRVIYHYQPDTVTITMIKDGAQPLKRGDFPL